MNKNKIAKNAVVIVLILIVLVIIYYGFTSFSAKRTESAPSTEEERTVAGLLDAETFEKVDIEAIGAPYDEINAVYKGMDGNEKVIGYVAFLTIDGYGGPMNVNVATDEKGEKILNLRIGDNNENEGYKEKIEDKSFYGQFTGVSLPVTLLESAQILDSNGDLMDGTYTAKEEKPDEYGFIAEVEMKIADKKIASVTWDEKNSQEDSKKNLSIKGDYTLEESGLLWHEQAALMEDFLVQVQNPKEININQEGRTTDVEGVTMPVNRFLLLAHDCYDQATGTKKRKEVNVVDNITGATVSCTAVVNAANIASDFISENLNK